MTSSLPAARGEGPVVRTRFPMREWEKLDAFVARNLRPDTPLRARPMFDWTFDVEDDSANILSVWDGDRLTGMLGYHPVTTQWGEAEVTAAWIGHWMVDAAYRHGAGLRLLAAARALFPLLLGSPWKPESAAIMQRLGATLIPALPRSLVVFDPQRVRDLLLPGARSARLDTLRHRPAESGGVTPYDPAAYRPDWTRYPAMAYCARRSPDFIAHRYRQHPAYAYRVYIAGEAGEPALCATRIERALDDETVLVGRIVDFFHPAGERGRESGLRALAAASRDLASAGCVFADFTGSPPAFHETLAAAGWGLEEPEHPLLPNRIQPVERKPFRHNLIYLRADDILEPEAGRLYVTRADWDLDAPQTLSEIESEPLVRR